MALQGPHQGAQKSTSRGVVAAATVALKLSVVRLAILSDILIKDMGLKEWLGGRERKRGN